MVIFFILLPILFDDPLAGDAQRCSLPDSHSAGKPSLIEL
jgi:hypothetical protein